MPFNYGQIEDTARVIHLSIPYENMGTIELDYRPAAVRSREDMTAADLSATDMLLEVVASWDVTWPDGSAIKLDKDDLAKVVDTFKQHIVNAVYEDAYRGEAHGARIRKR